MKCRSARGIDLGIKGLQHPKESIESNLRQKLKCPCVSHTSLVDEHLSSVCSWPLLSLQCR